MNSHLIVRIINHMIIFLSFTFSISIKLVLWIWRVDFSKCSENHIKKQRDGVYIFLRRRSEELIRLFRIFMEFPEQIISRATENNCFWSFWYFFSKLFSRSSGLKPFTGYLSFVKNFPEFCEFSSIWRKSIPKKFSLQGSFGKLDACKEIFSNSFTKINFRLTRVF